MRTQFAPPATSSAGLLRPRPPALVPPPIDCSCRASQDATELIESDDVDVVHICTPNATHVALAERALAAGKHVVCEKPLATTRPRRQRLSNAARTVGVVAAVPFVYRYYPTVREARARIAEGEAGPLWLLHGSYLQDWLSQGEETNWRVDPAKGGGSRAFGDIGVHWCDLMEFTTGHRITRLSARMARAFPKRGATGAAAHVTTEDGALVLFETDQGASGSVVVSQVSPGRKNRLSFSFDGPRAAYVFDQETPDSLWVGGRRSQHDHQRGPDTLSSDDAQLYARLPAGHPAGVSRLLQQFVGDVYATVAGDATRRTAHVRRWAAGSRPYRGGRGIGKARHLGRGGRMNHAPSRDSRQLLFINCEDLSRAPTTPRTYSDTAPHRAAHQFTNGWSNQQ